MSELSLSYINRQLELANGPRSTVQLMTRTPWQMYWPRRRLFRTWANPQHFDQEFDFCYCRKGSCQELLSQRPGYLVSVFMGKDREFRKLRTFAKGHCRILIWATDSTIPSAYVEKFRRQLDVSTIEDVPDGPVFVRHCHGLNYASTPKVIESMVCFRQIRLSMKVVDSAVLEQYRWIEKVFYITGERGESGPEFACLKFEDSEEFLETEDLGFASCNYLWASYEEYPREEAGQSQLTDSCLL